MLASIHHAQHAAYKQSGCAGLVKANFVLWCAASMGDVAKSWQVFEVAHATVGCLLQQNYLATHAC